MLKQWKEIKKATLQKMFSWEGESSLTGGDTQEYIRAMPHAANEGLRRIYNKIPLRHSCELPCQEGENWVDTNDIPDWRGLGARQAYLMAQEDGHPIAWLDVVRESDRFLRITTPQQGTITLYYDAWPPELEDNTPDDTKLDIEEDAAAILPLYMAGELYADDDVSLATSYRNRFEMELESMEIRKRGMVQVDTSDCPSWAL